MVKPKRGPVRAYAYMRLSVDKEGGVPQSIDAQRTAIRSYAAKKGMVIVEEFADDYQERQLDRRELLRKVLLVTGSCPQGAQDFAAGCLSKPYPQNDLISAIDATFGCSRR